MAKLDRVLASVEWESRYPLAKVIVLPKGVNDYNLVMVDCGRKIQDKDHLFRFEKWWLEIEGFSEVVIKAWESEFQHIDPLETCQFKIRLLRKKIRGWHRNIEAYVKKKKVDILGKIDLLDKIAELHQLSDQEMEERKS
jgi:hypothetical protein